MILGDPDRMDEYSMMEEDKILFEAADKNQDGKLSQEEFLSFTHPEEDAEMISLCSVVRTIRLPAGLQ